MRTPLQHRNARGHRKIRRLWWCLGDWNSTEFSTLWWTVQSYFLPANLFWIKFWWHKQSEFPSLTPEQLFHRLLFRVLWQFWSVQWSTFYVGRASISSRYLFRWLRRLELFWCINYQNVSFLFFWSYLLSAVNLCVDVGYLHECFLFWEPWECLKSLFLDLRSSTPF